MKEIPGGLWTKGIGRRKRCRHNLDANNHNLDVNINGSKMTCDSNCEEEFDQLKPEIDGETRRNIVLIVKEAIHNIIKHSGSDKVNLTINSKRSQLTITIADNGRGIVDTQIDAAGNGMKNMRKRIEKRWFYW